MPIDPAKLGALVDEQNANPFGNVPMKPQAEGESEGEEEEKSKAKSPKERGDELLDSMGEDGIDLRENADILIEVAAEIGDDLKADMPAQETVDAVMDAVDRMPDFLSENIMVNIANKEEPDQFAIASALTENEDETQLLAGFFGVLEGQVSDDDGEGDDEDEDEGGEGDEEMVADDAMPEDLELV